MTIAEGLRRFRKDLHLTQKEVADTLGIFPQAYQRYERGVVIPAITVLITLANVYNVTIDYLVGREEWKVNDNDLQNHEQAKQQDLHRADAADD